MDGFGGKTVGNHITLNPRDGKQKNGTNSCQFWLTSGLTRPVLNPHTTKKLGNDLPKPKGICKNAMAFPNMSKVLLYLIGLPENFMCEK